MGDQIGEIRFIFGDQLNSQHSWYRTQSDEVLYVMAELHRALLCEASYPENCRLLYGDAQVL